MTTYKTGNWVTALDGPMKGIAGIVIHHDKKRGKYLVRFTGMQQLFYTDQEIVPWKDRK